MWWSVVLLLIVVGLGLFARWLYRIVQEWGR